MLQMFQIVIFFFVFITILFCPFFFVAFASWRIYQNGARLHIGTALVLAVLSGVLLGLNLTARHAPGEVYYGFPIPAFRFMDSCPPIPDIDESYEKMPSGKFLMHDDIVPNDLCVFWNVIVALAVLAWAWFLFEKHIQGLEYSRHKANP